MSILTRSFSSLALLLFLLLAGAGCTAKMKAAYHQNRADRYYDAGQFDQAEIEYKGVLRNAPQNSQALSRLGQIYYWESRHREAALLLARASQLDTNNLPVRLKLANIYLSAGKYREARDLAGFILNKDPRDPQAPILLAEAAISTNEMMEVRRRLQTLAQTEKTAPLDVAFGTLSFRERDLKSAEGYFKDAVRLDAKFSDAYSALGNLYLAKKDVKQADQAFKTAMELSPPRSGKTLLYAQFKILTGEADIARSILQDLLNKAPDYLPGWIALAQLAAAQKNYDDGITLLGNVLSRDPRNPDALLLRGRLEMEKQDMAQAIKDFEAVTRSFPDVALAYYQLAKAQAAINDFNNATANLNQALKLNPTDADASLLLAEVQIYTGKTEPAISSLQQLLRRQPQFTPARFMLATAYARGDRLEDAIKVYRDLEESFPTNSRIPLLTGTILVQQMKFAEARTEFDRAQKLAPDGLGILEQQVNLDILEKKYDSARQRVQPPLNKYPKSAPLYLLLARVQMAQGETAEAESSLNRAIELSSNYPPAYLMLARLHASSHENQKAIADLATVLAKNPKDTEALLLLGATYSTGKDYPKARDAYEKVLAVDSNNIVALNNLACLYSENLGQLDQGYQLARRARETAPKDASSADTLGWILFRQGQFNPALNLLRESAGKLVSDPVAQFHLGMTFYFMGDEANARATFQRAIETNQDFPEKEECRQCLSVLAIDPATAGADKLAWLEKRVASQPKDNIARLRLAEAYQHAGMPEKAMPAYEAVIEADPQNVPALVDLARLYAAKDPQKGFQLAKTAYKLAPNDESVLPVLGRLAFLTGDYSWSLSLLQLAARSQPKDPAVLHDLAETFYSVDRVADAQSSMQNALTHDPGTLLAADARRFLAMTGLADRPDQALAAESQVTEILNSTPEYTPALMARAAIQERKRDPVSAQETYEAILKQYPDFLPAQKKLLLLYADNPNNDAKVFALATKARQASPSDPEIAKVLGMVVYRQGDFARAAGLLAEGARQLNRDADLMYYLGRAEYQLKHLPQCKIALQQALDLNLSGPKADDARRIMAELK